MRKTILKIMLGTVILEAILVCIFILAGDFDEVAWRTLGSVGIIFGYSIPCLFYSRIYNNEKYKNIAIWGAISVCIPALINILDLWGLIGRGEFFPRITGTFNVIVGSLVFISWLLSYTSTNNLVNLFKKISISLITLLSFFIILIIWTMFPEGFLLRLYYVLVVLTFGSFICTLILTIIYKKEIIGISQPNKNDQTQIQNQNSVKAPPTIGPSRTTDSTDNDEKIIIHEQVNDNNESNDNKQ